MAEGLAEDVGEQARLEAWSGAQGGKAAGGVWGRRVPGAWDGGSGHLTGLLAGGAKTEFIPPVPSLTQG